MEEYADEIENEMHQLQFVDADGSVPLSISFVIRYHPGRQIPSVPLEDADLIVIQEELKRYDGRITSLLK